MIVKLEPKHVLEIFELIRQDAKNKDIAALYNVSTSTISDIKSGRNWKSLQEHRPL